MPNNNIKHPKINPSSGHFLTHKFYKNQKLLVYIVSKDDQVLLGSLNKEI